VMTRTFTFAVLALVASNAHGQLRPRRVGTNALGDQEVVLTDVPAGGGAAGGADADPLEAMRAAMAGGGEGMDLEAMMKGLEDNPMMKQMAEGIAATNPEVAELLKNPAAMAEQMKEMQRMMSSPEGQGQMQKMMSEMSNVMNDPEKLKEGIKQFAENPAFQGLADSIPGMKEMLEDPEALNAQVEKVSEQMQALSDPDKLQELLGQLGGGEGGEMLQNLQKLMSGNGEGLQEAMANMGKLMQGAGAGDDDEDPFAALGMGDDEEEMGGGDDLKARVREQMAQMMNKRRGAAAADEDEF